MPELPIKKSHFISVALTVPTGLFICAVPFVFLRSLHGGFFIIVAASLGLMGLGLIGMSAESFWRQAMVPMAMNRRRRDRSENIHALRARGAQVSGRCIHFERAFPYSSDADFVDAVLVFRWEKPRDWETANGAQDFVRIRCIWTTDDYQQFAVNNSEDDFQVPALVASGHKQGIVFLWEEASLHVPFTHVLQRGSRAGVLEHPLRKRVFIGVGVLMLLVVLSVFFYFPVRGIVKSVQALSQPAVTAPLGETRARILENGTPTTATLVEGHYTSTRVNDYRQYTLTFEVQTPDGKTLTFQHTLLFGEIQLNKIQEGMTIPAVLASDQSDIVVQWDTAGIRPMRAF